jgi:large subunit ribosomal protein L15
VNLSIVQAAIDSKRLDAMHPVNSAALVAAGVISAPKGGVRLLGKGTLTSKVAFEVYHATAGAVAAVEKAGGSVKMLKPVEKASEAK